MVENNNEVLEAVQTLAQHMDERFDAVDRKFDAVDRKFDVVDQTIGKLRSDMIDYVGRTVENAKGEIIRAIKTDRERQKLLDTKILFILGRNKLARPEEIEAMQELLA